MKEEKEKGERKEGSKGGMAKGGREVKKEKVHKML